MKIKVGILSGRRVEMRRGIIIAPIVILEKLNA
jgi:hypothetical protein